jgi:flagellar hook assembly protein FlgD
MEQNYPNPFNPSTQIRFGLPNAAVMTLTVYDVLGREVQTLSSGHFAAGYHTVTWNASEVASGVYFARVTVNDEAGKAVLHKNESTVADKIGGQLHITTKTTTLDSFV